MIYRSDWISLYVNMSKCSMVKVENCLLKSPHMPVIPMTFTNYLSFVFFICYNCGPVVLWGNGVLMQNPPDK